jgi:hypothetical protein
MAVALGLLCGCGGVAMGDVIVPNSTFDVAIINDPTGGDFSQTGIPLSTTPTTIDNGRMQVSEVISPVDANTAWIQWTFTATNGQPFVGDPGSGWRIDITNVQTTGLAATTQLYDTFIDAKGTSTPFPYPGVTPGITDNPIPGQPGPVDLEVVSPPYDYTTSQGYFSTIVPFDQGPTNFGNGGPVPVTYLVGAQYQLQAVPEPSPVVLIAVGGLVVAGARLCARRWGARPGVTAVAA